MNGWEVGVGLRESSTNGGGGSGVCKIDLPFRFKLNADKLGSYQAGMQYENVGVKGNLRGDGRLCAAHGFKPSAGYKWAEDPIVKSPLRQLDPLKNKRSEVVSESTFRSKASIYSRNPDELNNLLLDARKLLPLATTAALPPKSGDSDSKHNGDLKTKSHHEEKTSSKPSTPDVQNPPSNIIGSDEHSSEKCPRISVCSPETVKARQSNENSSQSERENENKGRNRCAMRRHARSSKATAAGRYCAGGRCEGRRGHQGFVLPGSTEKSRIKHRGKKSGKPSNRCDKEC